MDSTMEPRRIGRSILDVVVASPLFVTAPLWRRWHQRWGATDQEVRAPMPGDDLLAKASFNATRAITIQAPPGAVWPWIVQIGYDRAGWYSYDLFDHGARPSARRILPQLQHPKVGDWGGDVLQGERGDRLQGAGVRAGGMAAVDQAGQHLGVETPPAGRRQGDPPGDPTQGQL
jgi:hypothetical protein